MRIFFILARPLLLVYKMNVFGHILVFRILDTSILVISNSDRTEYIFKYSLRPILLFINTDISSSTKIYLDTSILATNNMNRRE
jgi:hypothetical protein